MQTEWTSSHISGLKPSLEDQYLSSRPETPSDIYMELAILAVSRNFIFSVEGEISTLTEYNDVESAIKDAKQALAYRIGARAAYADFGSGKNTQLQALEQAMKGTK